MYKSTLHRVIHRSNNYRVSYVNLSSGLYDPSSPFCTPPLTHRKKVSSTRQSLILLLCPVASRSSSNRTSLHTSPRSPQRCASKPRNDLMTTKVEMEGKWTRARTPRWCTASSSRVKLRATFPKTQLVGRQGGIEVLMSCRSGCGPIYGNGVWSVLG